MPAVLSSSLRELLTSVEVGNHQNVMSRIPWDWLCWLSYFLARRRQRVCGDAKLQVGEVEAKMWKRAEESVWESESASNSCSPQIALEPFALKLTIAT